MKPITEVFNYPAVPKDGTEGTLLKTTRTVVPHEEKVEIRSLLQQCEEVLLEAAKSDPDAPPLEHVNHFAEGLYGRELHMPAGMIITSKIHKQSHFTFVLKGKAQVIDPLNGGQLIEAPCFMKTEPGTKRILKILEDSVWMTVHAADSQDEAEIQEEILAKDWAEIDNLLEHQT